MNVSYALLADFAEVVNGKLYVLGGGITILWRNQFPAPLDVSVVVGFEYSATEAGGERNVRMQVIDADAKAIVPPLEANFTLSGRASGVPVDAPLGTLFAVRIAGPPVLPKPGSYAVEIAVDREHAANVPFVVAIPGAE